MNLKTNYNNSLLTLNKHPNDYALLQQCTELGREYHLAATLEDRANRDPLGSRYSVIGQAAEALAYQGQENSIEQKVQHDIQMATQRKVN